MEKEFKRLDQCFSEIKSAYYSDPLCGRKMPDTHFLTEAAEIYAQQYKDRIQELETELFNERRINEKTRKKL